LTLRQLKTYEATNNREKRRRLDQHERIQTTAIDVVLSIEETGRNVGLEAMCAEAE
jgi:hypothetical protein